MYSKTKRMACFLLCFLILFVGFADVLTAPAKAEPLTLAAGASALIWILGLMGITFASVEAARIASDHIAEAEPEIFTWIDELGGGGGDPGPPNADLLFNAMSLGILGKIVERLKDYFSEDEDGEIEVTEPGYSVPDIPGLKLRMMPEGMYFTDFIPSFSNCDYFYDMSKWNGTYWSNPCTFFSFVQEDGSMYRFIIGFGSSSGSMQQILYTENTAPGQAYYLHDMEVKKISLRTSELLTGTMGVGFLAYPYRSDYYLKPYFCLRYTDSEGILRDVPVRLQSNTTYSYKLSGVPEQGVVQVPYKSDSEYSYAEIEEALEERVFRDGPFTITIPQATEETVKKTQDEIITEIEIRDILAEIRDNLPTDPDPSEPDEEFDPDKNKMPQELIYKFPFCVPFDLIDLVGALNAPAKAPVFTIPVKFDFVNYEDEIVINLSGWEKAAKAVRWGTTLFFMLGLTMVTRKLIKG